MPVSLDWPGKQSAVIPGSGIAEDEPRKYPSETSEDYHTSDETHGSDASAIASNKLDITIDGHDSTALIHTGADYSVLKMKLSRRHRKSITPSDGPARLLAVLWTGSTRFSPTEPSIKMPPAGTEVVPVVHLKPYCAH